MLCAGITHPYELERERVTARLASFLSKIIEKKPADTEFKKYKLLDRLVSKCKVSQPGAQPVAFPIGDGVSPNFRRGDTANLYAVVGSAGDDVARMATFDMVNMYDQLIISGREHRELTEPRIIDRMAYQRDKILKTNLKNKSADLFATTQAANKITSLYVGIDSTGSLGGVANTDVSGWASVETDHSSADFSVGGYENMITTHQNIEDNKGNTSLIVMTKTLMRKLEMQYDADIRYAKTGELARGATGIKFKEIECIWDSDATASYMWFLDLDDMEYRVNSECDMQFLPLTDRQDQDAFGALFRDEFQLVIKNRRQHGKIKDIV